MENSFRTIIAATDFSPEAENAVDYAGALAKALGTDLVLYNSFNIPVHAANARLSAESIQQLQEQNDELLRIRAEELSEIYGIKAAHESGLLLPVQDELSALAQKYNAGLVVMGMAPRSLAQDLLGNTTTSVMMKLEFPVLAVPLSSKFDGFKKIVFACEDVEETPKGIINKISKLATALGSVLEIFHVDRNQSANVTADVQPEKIAGLKNVPHFFKDVAADSVIQAIEKEVVAQSADLLIMVPQKYGFWASLTRRSKTRIMASNNHVPLLSIPAEPAREFLMD